MRHERTPDLRGGSLPREVEWISPAGQAVLVRSTRLGSFAQRSVAAILYEVEAVGADARIVVQSELVANEPEPEQQDDPRVGAAVRAPLVGESHANSELRASLVHRTRASGLRMAAGTDHFFEGPEPTTTSSESEPDLARGTFSTELRPGERLRVVKLLAPSCWSRRLGYGARSVTTTIRRAYGTLG